MRKMNAPRIHFVQNGLAAKPFFSTANRMAALFATDARRCPPICWKVAGPAMPPTAAWRATLRRGRRRGRAGRPVPAVQTQHVHHEEHEDTVSKVKRPVVAETGFDV
jgi:hypothetical protein